MDPIFGDHNIDQLVVKPMNNYDPNVVVPFQTFYMDDMYFRARIRALARIRTDTGVDTGTDSGSDTDAVRLRLSYCRR